MTSRFQRLDSIAPDQSLSDRTAEVLRGLVVDGDYQPGERLNEVEIAAALGVSRGPVREAIQRLAVEGFVTLVPRKGAYIADFDPSKMVQLYEVREALEGKAAALAADRAQEKQLDELAALLESTEKRFASASAAHYPSDVDDFHRRVVILAGNPFLLAQCDAVQTQIRLARSRSGYIPERARDALREHQVILRAVARRDAEGAESAMRAHVRKSLQSIEALCAAAGETES